MSIVSESTKYDPVIPTHIPYHRKTSPTWNQSNNALVNKIELFLMSFCLTIYTIFSGFSPLGKSQTYKWKIFSFSRIDAWISTVVHNLTTKIKDRVAHKSPGKMSSITCSDWLQTRLSVHFFASLAVGNARNALIQTLIWHLIRENQMFSQSIGTQQFSSSLRP